MTSPVTSSSSPALPPPGDSCVELSQQLRNQLLTVIDDLQTLLKQPARLGDSNFLAQFQTDALQLQPLIQKAITC